MIKNNAATVLIYCTAISVVGLFLWLLTDLLIQGLPKLSPAFLFEAPRDAGRAGGIGPIIIATGWIVLVAISTAAPLALATAVWLVEFTRPDVIFSRFVEFSIDVLASVPSIVFGLFGNAFFCVYLGLGFSIISGGLTLACMTLPILIRTVADGLRAVPDDYRRVAAALGMTRGSALVHLLLPSAAPALTAGFLLGIGRAAAETAALIFTSGYVDRMPGSLFDSGRALSIHIYDLSMNVAGGDANAHATALVLIVFLLIINNAAIGLLRHWQKQNIAAS
ncbi:MAG: phosphate ABC transporter, permease protein PstA [Gammaproteobacteria bacterium HGW-Gammaproteobacteria-10]|nr:MAG: phosphate ABC transporter, permease protein PstA [Gammaproteobacteria bacterium HGW-Gammaproteobacteria-10]